MSDKKKPTDITRKQERAAKEAEKKALRKQMKRGGK